MKREMDLVRALLLWMEEHEDQLAGEIPRLEGWTEEQVGYHAYLMNQAGLIVAIDLKHIGQTLPAAIPLNLTWDGHEFLNSARDESKWKKARAHVLSSAGSMVFDLVKWALQEQAKKVLPLP